MLHQPCGGRDSYYLSIDVVAESQRVAQITQLSTSQNQDWT